MVTEDKSKKDNLKNSLCYIPFVSVVFFFTESGRSEEFNKHIKYGIFLLIAYIILMFFLGWAFGGLLVLIYVGVSGFLGYKAYNGEHVELEVFDTIEKSVKEKLDDNKKVNSEVIDNPLEGNNNTKTEL